MDTPLVDPEGFPRADIDVAGVRTARVHIIRLRNDLRALLREMEQLVLRGLPREAGDPSRDEGLLRANGDMRMNGEGGHDEEDDEQERPFARVDAVAPNSPAHQAVTSPFSLFFSSSVKSRQTDFGSRPPGACVLAGSGPGRPPPLARFRLVHEPRQPPRGRGARRLFRERSTARSGPSRVGEGQGRDDLDAEEWLGRKGITRVS